MSVIKTLLIDNYDSFTCNLYHLIAAVNGIPPVLIHHDEPGWTAAHFNQFDNIILSPGPGRPDREKDFGLCADAIRQRHIPVLGICLGHQGICYFHGGQINLAKEAYHGRISSIFHHGQDLFAGIPSPFSVVRYHSLIASELPETLEVIATTHDDLIMGVRHKTWPQWGVQFHPESICSEYGRQVLVNFAQLTRTWWRNHPRLGNFYQGDACRSTTKSSLNSSNEYDKWTILHREIECQIASSDISWLFNECFRKTGPAIWLDSCQNRYGSGRFSFLCAPSGPYGRIMTADVLTGTITVKSNRGHVTTYQADCFEWLATDLKHHQLMPLDVPFDFALGWLGYLGYELKAQCGAKKAHQSPYPDACLLFCDRGIVVDHQENKLYLLVLNASQNDVVEANHWLDEIERKIEIMTRIGRTQNQSPTMFTLTQPIRLLHDKAQYIQKIKASQAFIRQGETYEVCLTNTVYGATDAHPWDVYQKLRESNPAPYSAFMQFENISVISCSPERFLRISSDKTAISKPIKGTRPRGADEKQDRLIRQELAEDVKERAENLMIVDLVRHDLGMTAAIGSVKVPKLFAIESYQTVHQMVSTITSKIRPDCLPCQCVRYAFPGGSMTGAPKKRTMEILDQLEGKARGIYSGALGYFSLCGAVDLSIVIRTLVMDQQGRFSFGVGGAITALSDPEAEFEEIQVKAKAFLDVFQTHFPDC